MIVGGRDEYLDRRPDALVAAFERTRPARGRSRHRGPAGQPRFRGHERVLAGEIVRWARTCSVRWTPCRGLRRPGADAAAGSGSSSPCSSPALPRAWVISSSPPTWPGSVGCGPPGPGHRHRPRGLRLLRALARQSARHDRDADRGRRRYHHVGRGDPGDLPAAADGRSRSSRGAGPPGSSSRAPRSSRLQSSGFTGRSRQHRGAGHRRAARLAHAERARRAGPGARRGAGRARAGRSRVALPPRHEPAKRRLTLKAVVLPPGRGTGNRSPYA